MSAFFKAHAVLSAIYKEGAYVHIALKNLADDPDRRLATKLTYGVLEHHFELTYVIGKLADVMPKTGTKLVIMLAAYALRYLNTPVYAVVNECVKLAYDAEKGFANAVIRRIADGFYPLPSEGQRGYEEVIYNLPQWAISLIKKDYPKSYKKILEKRECEKEHVRLAKGTAEKLLLDVAPDATRTENGFFVSLNDGVIDLLDRGLATVQAYTSTLAVTALGDVKGLRVADICAAPGGKTVYLAELGADVYAYDIHPHRADLIRAYAYRMGVKPTISVADGTVFDPKLLRAFDIVIVDAPCSGLGMLSKRQDIVLHRSASAIDELVTIQKALLANASRYVKPNGRLLYCTCTVLKSENSAVTSDFLTKHTDFKKTPLNLSFNNDGEVQILPDSTGKEGFYLCQMQKS